jgi:hypothetical protein
MRRRVGNHILPCINVTTDHHANLHYHVGDLLGALYLMIGLDMTSRRYYYHCESCGKRFPVLRSNRKYCSKHCKWRKNSKAFRRRKQGS